jgi:hypothetical protein
MQTCFRWSIEANFFRRASSIIDGVASTRERDLPVQALVINLKAVKALDVSLQLQGRADEVIE